MAEGSLQNFMEKYIHEKIELEKISPKIIVHLQTHLIESPMPFLHLGYLRFLKSNGCSNPTLNQLNSHFIGRYWEFLIQHHGAIQTGKAMRALRVFWIWCRQNNYIKQKMPADLISSSVEITYPFKINISLSQKIN